MSTGSRRPAAGRGKRRGEQAEPDLELLALEDHFAAERTAGRDPHLADYLAASPGHAAELAAFAAEYLDEAEDDAPDAGRGTLSAGTRRALDLIFAGVPEEGAARRVAEAREGYDARSPRLLDLARERGLTAEALAEMLGLTPWLVRWLDATPLAPGDVPAALVARVAGALGVSEEAVWAALGGGGARPTADAGEPATFRAALLADAALPDDARARWLATLDEAGE